MSDQYNVNQLPTKARVEGYESLTYARMRLEGVDEDATRQQVDETSTEGYIPGLGVSSHAQKKMEMESKGPAMNFSDSIPGIGNMPPPPPLTTGGNQGPMGGPGEGGMNVGHPSRLLGRKRALDDRDAEAYSRRDQGSGGYGEDDRYRDGSGPGGGRGYGRDTRERERERERGGYGAWGRDGDRGGDWDGRPRDREGDVRGGYGGSGDRDREKGREYDDDREWGAKRLRREDGGYSHQGMRRGNNNNSDAPPRPPAQYR